MRIRFKKLDARAQAPTRGSAGAAGYDLRVLEYGVVPAASHHVKESGVYVSSRCSIFHTGVAVEIPLGFEGQVRLRSSVGRKGLVIPNAPATIDSDYRGELMIQLWNITNIPIEVEAGERVAQLLIVPVLDVEFEEAAELSDTQRGAGGFGSTGKF